MHEPTLIQARPIGYLTTATADAAQVAPQATDAPAQIAEIRVRPDLVDGLLGLDRYRYLWLLTWLDRAPTDPPLQLVPRALEATGEIQGVFASRSPARPNPIGLSLVRHVRTEGDRILMSGIDLRDGTPVLDIKPWFDDCDNPRSYSGPST